MIRTLAAVTALAAIPTFAAAQTWAYDSSGLTVRAAPNAYSITIDVAGKAPWTVHREIWDAAYTVCQRAPMTGNVADLKVEAMQTCVHEAQWNAEAQYDRMPQG